jgi:hypothetical protein
MRSIFRLKGIGLLLFFILGSLFAVGDLLFVAGLSFLCLLTRGSLPDGTLSSIIFMTALTVIVLYIDLWVFVLVPKNNYDKYKRKYGDMPIFYEFSETGMTVDAKAEGFEEHVRFAYDKFDKAVETKEFFILSENSATAYIIGKNEITEGTAEQLRALFKNNIGNKFKG